MKPILITLLVFGPSYTLHAEAPPSPDLAILRAFEIEPTTESNRSLFRSFKTDESTITEAKKWIAQLGSENFAERETAQKKLEAMPKIPPAALLPALESTDPEIRKRARQLQLLQTPDALSAPLLTFAALRTITSERIPGLAEDILTLLPKSGSPSARTAAIHAFLATASPDERKLLRETLGKGEDLLAEDSPLPTWRNFFDGHLVHGKGEGGNKTDFIKGIPPKILACFSTETKTARTTGSVASRNTSEPWLYPLPGLGEIPQVFEIAGKRHYPIWGTWRQKYSEGIISLDENGSLLNCTHNVHNGNIHFTSMVDFVVLP